MKRFLTFILAAIMILTAMSCVGDTATGTVASYTVSYNANGGEGAPAPQVKVQGQPLVLSTDVPTRADAASLIVPSPPATITCS